MREKFQKGYPLELCLLKSVTLWAHYYLQVMSNLYLARQEFQKDNNL